MDTNPYQSPTAAGAEGATDAPRGPIKASWLVRISVLLVIAIEIMPLEADVAFMFLNVGGVRAFLLVRVVCLALVLGPLVGYICLNGMAGVKAAKGRIAVVLIIVVMKVVWELFAVFHTVAR